MKRLTIAAGLVCACVLASSPARADDGGWWDNFWRFDPKLIGYSTEFHLLCLDDQGRRILGCEELYKNVFRLLVGGPKSIKHDFRVKNPGQTPEYVKADQFEDVHLRHEVDFRVGYYWNFGDRYDPPEPSIQGSIRVVKLMGIYTYHVPGLHEVLGLGGGIGYLEIYGDRFSLFSRSILTGSVIGYVPSGVPEYLKPLQARFEVNYIPLGFTAADFGDATVSHFSNQKEWNITLGIGYDFRRLRGY
ncbi:MAG TPA: hypothetical protein VNZ26_19785 [Vicinamibacterales bacterium]|jgi:hypothetical protein|nr:hypothetical protein [Vicinamibacterales bacterium]